MLIGPIWFLTGNLVQQKKRKIFKNVLKTTNLKMPFLSFQSKFWSLVLSTNQIVIKLFKPETTETKTERIGCGSFSTMHGICSGIIHP